MRRTTLYVILAVGVVLAIGGVLVWQLRGTGQSGEELRSTTVERGPMLVAVSASGSVEPQERVSLAFEGVGRVAEVPVEVGDVVRAGDVLVRLYDDRLVLQVEQARANLASAEAQLARLRAGARSEDVEAAQANLRGLEAQASAAAAERDQVEAGADAAQIAAAEAELASALTEQKKAEDRHDMTMECVTFRLPAGETVTLPGGEVITITESIEKTICPALGVPEEQARYTLEAANEALEAARSRLDEIKAGADVDQLRAAQANVQAAAAQREAAQAQLDLLLEGASDEEIAAAEAQVVQARAALDQAELSLAQAVLEAPFDGVVAEVNVTVGETASPGVPVVSLVDASRFHVTVGVDEMDVGKLEEGQTARITLDALPDAEVSGTVERVAQAAALNGGVVTYDVRLSLAPTDDPIRADMSANATIVIEELVDVLRIPTWVVRVDRDTGQTYVHRRVGSARDDIEHVDVELGVRYEGVAQVLEGLSEGDEVVRLPESTAFEFEHP